MQYLRWSSFRRRLRFRCHRRRPSSAAPLLVDCYVVFVAFVVAADVDATAVFVVANNATAATVVVVVVVDDDVVVVTAAVGGTMASVGRLRPSWLVGVFFI